MIGPIVNSSSTLVGGVVGGLLGDRLSEKFRTQLPLTFGAASMGMGIFMVVKMHILPAVIASLLLGAIIGELFSIEKNINRMASKTRGFIDKLAPRREGASVSHDEFLDKFVGILVLFVASGTGIFGSMNEGITGDPSILFAKSLLDLFTAGIFATALGLSVATIAIPQFIVQVALLYLGQSIMAATTPEMVADFSALGGIIMFATGFRICGIKSFPIANLLPGLFIVMPISHYWDTLVMPWIHTLT
ncbi:DUF554 domain-containing protein [Consotaella salsifontis]|uniref:Membrane protein YdfK n=1 Tax=Consotaella salsifontis TaxID=1365950 RepID=A0A1T4TCP7_9HYPH|nr:DUF554 domain-containing protein [Consotaella salsifontis]SKA38187.1 hypothetical protein SAMN05428963_12432 [Consotaella salsifontis]